MATARLDIRLDEEIKAKAEKSSTLLGLKNLTEYVVRLMDEDTTHVIVQYLKTNDIKLSMQRATVEAAKITAHVGGFQ